ncbi:hypothetical protein CFP65_4570 [Kitasatospora sp. MMS16-BH015]|uniref:hypothetical protein n=1 Tax=Kitasatospora sp. MMS16-BH015 TaxID=2018025 RepID=UPI000CA158A1|nr:hypothetical protein [Kitasatospora sp. MMS16-BH015]AUG75381.1 hypothetical protein CFP65_0415 [Kitasatospora sp. MMS16-BH015]AUG75737.1 hypothetical protein CFP65_0790 [Kitasatospora sp. MMS16-BH015]AUG76090.1 hypothetical protein CFP65_1180 [Kitasatospora sp. MMS16-BH015]AUG79311.1 hypothetical protein CFP65_4570 [Kitasatospora sp. MMS16-BH015]
MPSVVGLLEQRELTARRRVDELREEADRIQAELVAAEREWSEWVIARSRVGEVLSPGEGDIAGPDAVEKPSDRGEPPALPASSAAAKPKSVVPMWRAGLARSALSADYQRIVQALADRGRLGQGPLTCQEMAACFGLDPVPAKIEALRSKAKRLTARGWLVEPEPGRFTLAMALAGPGGGS